MPRLAAHPAPLRTALTLAVAVAPLLAVFAFIAAVGAQATPPAEWFSATREPVTVWHTGSVERAESLAARGVGALDLVTDLLETPVEGEIVIIVWPAGVEPDPAAAPDEVQALDRGDPLIHVLDVTRDTAGDVQSAVTSLIINHAAAPHIDQVPLWLRLALGLWSQGPLPGFYLRRAGSVVVLDHERYYSFERLERLPVTWQFQALYFGQVGGMLSWMIQDWGPEALRMLFAQLSQGVAFDAALEAVYGIPADEFIEKFTGNAERALLLTWPYIEDESRPFWESINAGLVFGVVVAILFATGGAYIVKRLIE